jgi:hypothetical protein
MSYEILAYEAVERVFKQPIVVIPPRAEFPYRCELQPSFFHGYEYHVFQGDTLVFIGCGDNIERLQRLAEQHVDILNGEWHDLLFDEEPA